MARKKAAQGKPRAAAGSLEALAAEMAEVVSAGGGRAEVASDALRIRGIVSTGAPTVDIAIGRGGIPLGRVTIVHGGEGCGKTTVVLGAIRECQEQGGVAFYADAEHKFEPDYARQQGVDVDRLVVSHPPYLEKAFESMDRVIDLATKYNEGRAKPVPVVFALDSMNSLVCRADFEAGWDDEVNAYGRSAKGFSDSLPRVVPRLYTAGVGLILVSQVRQNLNAMFGSKEKIAGGKAPPHYACLILNLRRTKGIKRGDDVVGHEVVVKITKNQIAPPFRTGTFKVFYGLGADPTGLDYFSSLMDAAEWLGVVERSGAWWSYGGERIGQGMRQIRKRLHEDGVLRKTIAGAVRERLLAGEAINGRTMDVDDEDDDGDAEGNERD